MEKSSKSCRTTVGREESTSLAELKQYFDHCNFPCIIEFILASLNLFTTNARALGNQSEHNSTVPVVLTDIIQ